ncbi:MAG: ParB/RepB/Spo0J family partition protein [Verrucomicrobiaceae bacterium]|nr:ParB/RepB/Spo0J family partition protein [Verrucomicrobiaceae bacterium]
MEFTPGGLTSPYHQLITLPHREIAPSKTQPRTHFAPEKMAELKASLQAHGFTPALSHLLVRPFEYRWEPAHDPRNGMVFEVRAHESSPWERVRVRFEVPKPSEEGAPAWAILQTEDDIRAALLELPKYEIVDGERRWRTAGELIPAGLLPPELPAVIEPLSDAEALEMQLLNVLQREPLTPMEEAEGIVRLLEMKNAAGEPLYTRETAAAKIGCSVAHVGNQIRIARLRGTDIGDALEAEKITAKHARFMAELPAGESRSQLLKRVVAPGGPMPVRMLERVINDEFVVGLRGAEFDQTDPHLVVIEFTADYADGTDGAESNENRLRGGACAQMGGVPRADSSGKVDQKLVYECPFADVKNPTSPMCRNPECFRLKTARSHELWMEEVNRREGRPDAALSMEDAAAVFDQHVGQGRRLAFNSGYVELDAAPDESELKSGVQSPGNWRKLIKGQGVPVFYAKDSAHKVHEIVKRDLARKAAHLNGHEIFKDSAQQSRLDEEPSATAEAKDHDHDQEHEQETLARQAAQEKKRALHDAEMGAIVAAAEAGVVRGHVNLPTGAWTVMVLGMAEVLDDYGALGRILARRQLVIGLDENLSKAVSKWTMAQKVGFVVEGLIALSIDEDEAGDWAVWAKPFGVNLAAVRRRAEREAKLQLPSSKLQGSSKDQAPTAEAKTERRAA